VLQKASAAHIRKKADELGMGTLADDGWKKVRNGFTTREELLRVIAA
jgi:type II secretory ATPase GspE/PulE/Tfp pilus assembly ATPase PilB-like protein